MARRRPPHDRRDGYVPPTPPAGDPWSAPEVRAQMEARARKIARWDEMERWDGYVNELTGIGSWLKDKTLGGQMNGPSFLARLLSGAECEQRWRGSDLGGRIVETIPDEMTREGWGLTIQPTEDDEEKEDALDPGEEPAPRGPARLPELDEEGAAAAEAVEGKLEDLGAIQAFTEALYYERSYGGGAILVGADDGHDLAEPLDEDRIRDVTHLTAFRGGWDGEVVAWSYYSDPREPKYGQPEIYMVRNLGVPIARIPVPGARGVAQPVLPTNTSYGNGYGTLIFWVHESRFLQFPGQAVSRYARTQMRGWGDSVFFRVDEVLSQYGQTWGGIANLMTDFSQGYLKIDGLAQGLAANNRGGQGAGAATAGVFGGAGGGGNLAKRAQALQLSRSIARILLIDTKEEFGRDTVSLGGVGEVLQQFHLRLAAAADMPVSLLMGQAPAGLNATGDSEIRWFYDKVRSRQKKRMMPQVRRLISLVMKSKEGPTGGVEPERWSAEPKPLYQMSAAEQADVRLKVAQADQIYVGMGALSAGEIAASHFGGAEYSPEVQLDFRGREEMAAQDDADAEARKAALLEQAAKVAAGEVAPPGDDAIALQLTSTMQGAIVTVNQALAKMGLPPWPDKDGELTIAEFSAKHSEVVAASVNVEKGQAGGEPPPPPPPPPSPFGAKKGGMEEKAPVEGEPEGEKPAPAFPPKKKEET